MGLMPEAGIKRLLGPALPDMEQCHGIPRAELYLVSGDARRLHLRALAIRLINQKGCSRTRRVLYFMS